MTADRRCAAVNDIKQKNVSMRLLFETCAQCTLLQMLYYTKALAFS